MIRSITLFVFTLFITLRASATSSLSDTCIADMKELIQLDIYQKEFAQFDPYFKNRSVIAMGEATHGTHEFFQVKSNMFKYLVERFGFNVFALEANFNECEKVNQYILSGIGDSRQIVNEFMLWPWKTEEMLELIEWMKDYNQKHKKKLWFYGFDSGNSLFLGMPALKNYAKKFNEEIYNKILLLDSLINKIDTITKRDSVSTVATTMLQEWKMNAGQYKHFTEWPLFLHTLQTVIQNLEYYYLDIVYTVRDRHMAENIQWALRQSRNHKIFIWAHNAHVNKDGNFFDVRGWEKWGYKNLSKTTKPMGYFLKKELGSQSLIIGFEFNQGTFWVNYHDKSLQKRVYHKVALPPAPVQTLPYMLSQAKQPVYAIPLTNKSKNTCFTLVPSHNYGGGLPAERSLEPINLYDSYDMLIFVNKTTPSRALSTQ